MNKRYRVLCVICVGRLIRNIVKKTDSQTVTIMSSSRKENERTKFIQEKCQTLLTVMLRDEDNKYCVDCDAKGNEHKTMTPLTVFFSLVGLVIETHEKTIQEMSVLQ